MESIPRALRAPQDSFFLFGPRGSGKSTWLRQQFASALWVDLLEPDTVRRLQGRPEQLAEQVAQSPAQDVVIDEIQRVPALLDVVHRLIEQGGRKRHRFILTGSSTRKLKAAGTNLLGGRALLETMHPFMACELGRAFDLPSALKLGLLPVVRAAADPAATLKAYAGLYVREEVQAEGLVRLAGAFSRFLEAVALSHATVLNAAAVARECQVERRTVEGYLGVLEDIQLAFRLPVFAKRAKRKLTAHSKLYLIDPGVFQSLRPQGPLDSAPEALGPALEGLVAQQLRAWIAYGKAELTLHFWRTQEGQEVDFVLYGPGGFYAIEVKASTRFDPRDLAPLLAFKEDYPQAQVALIYTGREALKVQGIPVLPCQAFLAKLVPGRVLDF
jgi:predicted AAA+ superfamily ATPase